MTEEKNKKSKFLERLHNRYRLVVMNDDTFEEKFSLRLTPFGLVILLGSLTIVMIMIVTSLIAFTPLREYIPGYAAGGVRRDLVRLTFRSDSLEKALIEQNLFMENIGNVLRGNVKSDSTQNRPNKNNDYGKLKINASKKEDELRKLNNWA